jgi:EAL domain-containing protein (putative c-di-GMP-specific phosphodiesterase class I)
VTESVLLQNSESTLKSLYQLRELGVKIALDDFGTGYSSLSYLRNFPFDKLKIDRSFVQDLPASESARAIVEAITGLGASFKMSITAEGVEKQEQMDYLSAEGCQELQGFFIGRPKPASQLMQRSRWASAEAEETADPVFPATLESTETVSMAML